MFGYIMPGPVVSQMFGAVGSHHRTRDKTKQPTPPYRPRPFLSRTVQAGALLGMPSAEKGGWRRPGSLGIPALAPAAWRRKAIGVSLPSAQRQKLQEPVLNTEVVQGTDPSHTLRAAQAGRRPAPPVGPGTALATKGKRPSDAAAIDIASAQAKLRKDYHAATSASSRDSCRATWAEYRNKAWQQSVPGVAEVPVLPLSATKIEGGRLAHEA